MPRPHAGQRAILASDARFRAVSCGRRFGKTTIAMDRIIRPALAGFPAAWFAPQYKYLLEPWRDVLRTLRQVISRSDATERRIELITGGVIDFWTLEDGDAGRGRHYKRAVVDEAGKVKDLETCWNEAVRPTLADLRGDADLYGTPKGRNYFWKCFLWGQDPHEPDWASFQMPTSANPYIHPGEIDALRRQMPERAFRQEILAEFIEDSGGVFRNVAECVDKGRTVNLPPSEGVSYTMGVDLARVEDFTVIDVIDADGRQVYHERFNKISWERQIGAIVDAAGRYKAKVFVDSTGVGDPIFERLRAAGVRVEGYHFSNASKEALIDNLAMKIERGDARLMDVPAQTNELLAYEYEVTPSRNVRMNAPAGMHDDCVIALALAYWGLSRHRTFEIISL